MMFLLEDLNELNKINRSILKAIAYSYNDKPLDVDKTMSKYGISNNSKVYVNTLKDKVDGKSIHTWKYVTDVILVDDNVAGIILRSNKRQLLGIFKDRNDKYVFQPSSILKEIPKYFDSVNIGDGQETTSEVSVRNKMANVVKFFIEAYPNAKKNWDIMIITKDSTASEKRDPREKAKAGREIKPSEEGYSDYISKLKDNLKLRLEKYINSKIPDFQNRERLIQYLVDKNTFWVKKVKIFNMIYELDDTSMYDSDVSNQLIKIKAEYRMSIPGRSKYNIPYGYSDVSRFFLYYTLKGIKLELHGMNFGPGTTFEEGCEKLVMLNKEIKNP